MNHHRVLQMTAVAARLLIAAVAPAWASEVEAPLRLSLDEALALAATRHVEVIVAQARIDEALARLGQAGSVLLPHVNASASDTRQTRNLDAAGITLPGGNPLVGPFNAFDARLKLTQMLLDMGAIQRLRAARAGRALSLADYRKVKQDAIALVASLYLDAQRAVQALEPAHETLERDAARLRVAWAQRALGAGPAVESRQAEAAYAYSLQRWQAALDKAMERRLDLAAALGLPSQQPIIFLEERDPPIDDPPPSFRDAMAAVSTHPEVAVAQEQLRERQAERAAEASDVLPRVSASVDYGASGRNPSDAEATYALGAQVSLPFFEGGRRVFRVREVSSLVHEAEVRLSDAQQHVEAKALSAIESLQHTRALVRAADASLAVSINQLTLAYSRQRSGLGTALDVADANAQAAIARDQYAEALAAYRLAQVNVAHALGALEMLADPAPMP